MGSPVSRMKLRESVVLRRHMTGPAGAIPGGRRVNRALRLVTLPVPTLHNRKRQLPAQSAVAKTVRTESERATRRKC